MNFQSEENRIFAEDECGDTVAEITFPEIAQNTVCINHTFVDGALRGRGIASDMVGAVVDELRSKNLKAAVTCSYAIKWFEEHPENADVLCAPH